uniref:Uncharacterized protein n=1 Tax=Arion vulgaris TaxID=1028688 RepID=A0A0B6ZWU6_9EUPU
MLESSGSAKKVKYSPLLLIDKRVKTHNSLWLKRRKKNLTNYCCNVEDTEIVKV